ncbi:MAG: DUF350 domain-containing protein [Candidatus Saccharimonadales bacterium]
MEAVTLTEQNGLTVEALTATLLYTFIGVIILTLSVVALNKLFGLRVRKELITDQNTAVGIVIAGLSISIAIIISGTIGS